MRTPLAALALTATLSVVAASGCSTGQCCDNEDKDACRAPKPGTITTINTMCVVEHEDPVNPAVEPVVWKGQKYGLCCKGCRPKWEAMSEAERDAAVAQVAPKTRW